MWIDNVVNLAGLTNNKKAKSILTFNKQNNKNHKSY